MIFAWYVEFTRKGNIGHEVTSNYLKGAHLRKDKLIKSTFASYLKFCREGSLFYYWRPNCAESVDLDKNGLQMTIFGWRLELTSKRNFPALETTDLRKKWRFSLSAWNWPR